MASAVAVLMIAAPAAAAGLPKAGTLVPGRSLGGVRLGESPSTIRAALGRFYGTCQDCSRRTWYFWRPTGWHAPDKLRLGSTPLAVHLLVGATRTVTCGDYEALVRDGAHARTAYYLFAGRLWGFGLFRRGTPPCR